METVSVIPEEMNKIYKDIMDTWLPLSKINQGIYEIRQPKVTQEIKKIVAKIEAFKEGELQDKLIIEKEQLIKLRTHYITKYNESAQLRNELVNYANFFDKKIARKTKLTPADYSKIMNIPFKKYNNFIEQNKKYIGEH